jgi:hypothetical protein
MSIWQLRRVQSNPMTIRESIPLLVEIHEGGFMAADRNSKNAQVNESKTTQTAAQIGDQPKIVWDSSNMRSAYANVFNVVGVREEFVLFYGMNQAFDARQNELKVQLTDRIVLSP